MSSQVSFVQNQNNLLHGVRGVVYLDGEVAGAVQDITATQEGEDEIVHVYGSRFPQAKEIKNISVKGTIKTLIFDPTVQKLLKLTDPAKQNVIDDESLLSENSTESNVLKYSETQLSFGRSSGGGTPSLMPIFDIEVQSKVIGTAATGAGDQNVVGSTTYKGFVIKGVVIKNFELNLSMNSFWVANVTFVADKIIRIGDNNLIKT